MARVAEMLAAARQAVLHFQAGSPDAGLYAPGPPPMRAVSALA